MNSLDIDVSFYSHSKLFTIVFGCSPSHLNHNSQSVPFTAIAPLGSKPVSS